jgi:hypothetical protein
MEGMKMSPQLLRPLAVAVVAAVSAGALAEARTLTGTSDAKGLKDLRLDAHVGSVEIRATDAERISWTLKLEPDEDDGWFSGGRKDAQKAIEGAKVRAVVAGESYELELDLPRGTDFDDVEEHWTIEVPSRFAIDLEANVGEVRVEGIAGGVEAELNVGEMRIAVIKGDVRASLNVGDLRVESRTKSLGRVRLEANVGDASMRIAGKTIETNRSFPVGAGLSVSNDGEDDIEGRVNVGEVTVRVE